MNPIVTEKGIHPLWIFHGRTREYGDRMDGNRVILKFSNATHC